MPDRHIVDVHVLLLDGDHVLLTLRRDDDPDFDGRWHLPSGKLDAGESVCDAAAREAEEEVGIHVEPADLVHVHTLHANGSGPEPRLSLFFTTRTWTGEPTNREPDKCSAIDWWPLRNLPANTIAYPAAGIHAYRAGTTFSTYGWPPTTARTTKPLAE